VQTAVEMVVKDIREEVAELVAAARDSGCRFVVQGDTWRTRRVGHYLAVLLSWGDVNFSIQEVCAWVGVVEAPRTGEVYAAAFQKALEHVGLTTKDVLAGFFDHEGAVRKGLRLLSVPVVGCKTAAACPDNRPLVETTAAGKRAPKQRRCVVDDSSTGALVAAGEQVEPAPKRRRLAERPSGEDFFIPVGGGVLPPASRCCLGRFSPEGQNGQQCHSLVAEACLVAGCKRSDAHFRAHKCSPWVDGCLEEEQEGRRHFTLFRLPCRLARPAVNVVGSM
jgi:hypothetical protein